MKQFNPTKVFEQIRAESQHKRKASAETGRREQEKWAAYWRRRAVFHRLMNLFPSEGAGTMDVGRATELMIEYGQTLPVECVKAVVKFVSDRLAKLAADGKPVRDANLKEILLNLLLFANARDHAKVAEILSEAMRGQPDEVEAFRLCLVNWLVDKVVEGWPPLPDELKEPLEAERLPDDQVAPTGAGNGNTDDAALGKERLHFDPQTQTITLDGRPHKITDPKAFAVYETIASSCPQPLTKATLQKRVAGCRGDKKVRQLLNGLPKQLCKSVLSGPNGYWLRLNPLPNCSK